MVECSFGLRFFGSIGTTQIARLKLHAEPSFAIKLYPNQSNFTLNYERKIKNVLQRKKLFKLKKKPPSFAHLQEGTVTYHEVKKKTEELQKNQSKNEAI